MIFEGLLIKVSSSIKRLNSHVFAHLGDLLESLLDLVGLGVAMLGEMTGKLH